MQTKPENIVLYGRSLGSGPSCYLAQRLSKAGIQIGGLILQASQRNLQLISFNNELFLFPLLILLLKSPVLSIYRVAFNFRFTLPGDMFPNVDRIRDVTCPVFVIHGTHDEVVPFRNGEVLF